MPRQRNNPSETSVSDGVVTAAEPAASEVSDAVDAASQNTAPEAAVAPASDDAGAAVEPTPDASEAPAAAPVEQYAPGFPGVLTITNHSERSIVDSVTGLYIGAATSQTVEIHSASVLNALRESISAGIAAQNIDADKFVFKYSPASE